MHAGLLTKLFGSDRQWRGPCTVILDADATIQTSGSDSIVQGGAKVYAPRLISGRIAADCTCLLPDEEALVLVQVNRIRQATGEDLTQQTVLVVSAQHIAAVEFQDVSALRGLGLALPSLHRETAFRSA
jgi:hypothetical protein